MKTLSTILLSLFGLTVLAQQAEKTEGVVTYEYAYNWAKVSARLPYLSQEEKDRIAMISKNWEGNKTKMKLLFNPDQSLYTYESEQGESDDGRWSWRQQDYVIQRDFKNEKKTEIHEMLGKTFVVEDSLKTPQWRIMNQIKDIAGYVCMKAEAHDPIKGHKLTAWFAQDIPVPAGPERSFGLPGVIMELDINEGDVVLTATKVDFKDVDKDLALPKKLKGKKIKATEYDQLIAEHIKDSIKAHRNPYWAIRY